MQKTAYEMRISDWSSDVCSSDLVRSPDDDRILAREIAELVLEQHQAAQRCARHETLEPGRESPSIDRMEAVDILVGVDPGDDRLFVDMIGQRRSEEHTSELQSLMRTSYVVSCLNKKKTIIR